MNKTLVMHIIFLILLVGNAYAIGISPSRTIINFEPNAEHKITYTVYNQAEDELNARLYVNGDLNRSINLPQKNIIIPAKGTSSFDVTLKLPDSLAEPGTHDNRIGVVESAVSQAGITMVGAVTGVESQLYIAVPYPGKYASINLEVGDIIIGKPLKLKVIINNLGSEDIKSAKGAIEIFDSRNKQITILHTESRSIKTKENSEIITYWTQKDVQAGSYKAIATIDYDGNTARDEEMFRLGDLLIEIMNINITYIKNNLIKFDIDMQSLWNEVIQNVYGTIKIIDSNGKEIGNIKTESIEMPPWSRRTISQYWPVIDKGKYNAEVSLHYAGNVVTGIKDFEIKENMLKLAWTTYIIIVLSIIIVIILVLYTMAIKKAKNEI